MVGDRPGGVHGRWRDLVDQCGLGSRQVRGKDRAGRLALVTAGIIPTSGKEPASQERPVSIMFGLIFFGFAIFGIVVAVLGHPAFYRAMTGRRSGSADHPDSKGL